MPDRVVIPIHGSDHCPGGPDPIPCLSQSTPWIMLIANGQTLPGDSGFDPLLFDELYWDPALATDVASDFDDVFSMDVLTFGGTDYFAFRNRVDGWFKFEVYAEVDDTGDGGTDKFFELSMVPDPSGGVFPPDDGKIGAIAAWDNDGGSEMEYRPSMSTTRTVFLTDARIWSPRCRQNTGVDKGLGGHMKVWFLGGLGGTTDITDWEVATP